MGIEKAFFVSDLHGRKTRYEKLFELILTETPDLVLIGGDILPSGISIIPGDSVNGDFIDEYLKPELKTLKEKLGERYPFILVIAGNDDPKLFEGKFIETENAGLWKYINQKVVDFKGFSIAGYSYVPPTPFLLKDWEKYDVSRYVDVGSVSPEEGFRSEKKEDYIIRHETITEDLTKLSDGLDFDKTIFLFHSPPYNTNLDRINTKGKLIDHVQPDEHAGSIAIQRFIASKQPLLTLHGHIHESTSITGKWKDMIGRTVCLNASTNKRELSVIKFSVDKRTIRSECILI